MANTNKNVDYRKQKNVSNGNGESGKVFVNPSRDMFWSCRVVYTRKTEQQTDIVDVMPVGQ